MQDSRNGCVVLGRESRAAEVWRSRRYRSSWSAIALCGFRFVFKDLRSPNLELRGHCLIEVDGTRMPGRGSFGLDETGRFRMSSDSNPHLHGRVVMGANALLNATLPRQAPLGICSRSGREINSGHPHSGRLRHVSSLARVCRALSELDARIDGYRSADGSHDLQIKLVSSCQLPDRGG